MPARYGDPGLFMCGPDDIAPWQADLPPVDRRTPARPRAPTRAGWLVLRLCPACGPRYCPDHDKDNWWLKNFRPRV